jgi:hypothetical protein
MGGSAKTEGGTAVKETVPLAQATSDEAVLPERVQEALGQLVGAAKEGLLALSAVLVAGRAPRPARHSPGRTVIRPASAACLRAS